VSPKAPKFVSLEPDGFLSDDDFQAFTASERGAYATLIFYLYRNNGRVRLDEPHLLGLLKCTPDELHTILKKFRIKRGHIIHKRVQKELNRARKLMARGKKGAKARWDNQLEPGEGHAQAMPEQPGRNAKERDVTRRDEKVNKSSSRTNGIDRSMDLGGLDSDSLARAHSASSRLAFASSLRNIIPARTRADVAAIRNLGDWIGDGIEQGTLPETTWESVLGYARDARIGNNPLAVFFAALRDSLGYNSRAQRARRSAGT
jgi:uncharacterized protein YdaU (DUF1376 family)